MTWSTFFTDPSMVALMVISMVAGLVLYLWHKEPGPFDLRHMLLDSTTNKISVEKVGLVTALGVSSWGFISLIQDGKMTEFYFIGYMSAWSLARVASQGLSIYKGKDATNAIP